MTGILYVVATPIGNLQDITLRALHVLKTVDLIACEDTRHTRKLLSHFQIHQSTESFHEHNERGKLGRLTALLRDGKSIALVSDAGTPTISDPGYRLVRRCVEEGIRVVPIPGAVAAVAALSVSGLATNTFTFLGFPPAQTAARRALLEQVRHSPNTLIFYESPRRTPAFLRAAAEILGARSTMVARELTKAHETFYHGTLTALAKQFEGENQVLGEVTIVITGSEEVFIEKPALEVPGTIYEHLAAVMARTGLRKNDAIKVVAKERHLSRHAVYDALIPDKAGEE
ncbi:MAG: 16S rRNA (cytidine(1402)-2'-O)-methyltransferase [Acidobacteria bacterium]|nr:16S rRNA (cytidine(1402)-2'-O)-methyltransferase [Acidobacteriota bacterium]MBI3656714.1 16S rRNA (cytidine(1402)-2'-O)-methyltransferase [Acidobacteriota bacterium]